MEEKPISLNEEAKIRNWLKQQSLNVRPRSLWRKFPVEIAKELELDANDIRRAAGREVAQEC